MAFNKVILEARLTADPELKTTQSGVEYCNFSVAADRDYKNGEEKLADFIPVKAWRGSAKFISQYFKKGDPILLEGRIEVDKYTDNDGNNKTFTQVVVEHCTFTIGKKSSFDGNYTATAPAPTFTDVSNECGELPF